MHAVVASCDVSAGADQPPDELGVVVSSLGRGGGSEAWVWWDPNYIGLNQGVQGSRKLKKVFRQTKKR